MSLSAMGDDTNERRVHHRGRDLLQQAIRRFDLPVGAFYCTVMSGTLLFFSGGAILGAVLVLHAPLLGEFTILSFAVASSLFSVALAASACFYWEHVSERRAALLSILESYLDAQADVSRYARREAH